MSRKRSDRAQRATYSVLALLLIAGGCDMPRVPGPEELPSALKYMVDNAEQFAQDADDPLFDLPPGTVADDLNELDGCWGAAYLSEAESADGKPLLAIYFLEVFDAETGKYIGWVLQEDAFGLMQAVGGHEGTFSVIEDNRLVTEWLRASSIEPVTVDPLTFEWVEDQELPEPRVLEFLATLSNDRLRLHFGEADREAVDPGDDCVYVRFDCPEEDGGE